MTDPSKPSATRADQESIAAQYRLTPREVDVLRHVITGRTNKEIALLLDPVRRGTEEISHQTVATHLKSIFRKIGVTTRTQAAIFAMSVGFTPPGDE